MTNQKRYIGQKIRSYRKEHHWSAKELGLLINPVKSEAAVTSWERGRTKPDGDVLIQLCRIFDKDLDDFYLAVYKGGGDDSNAWVEVPLYGSIAAGKPIEMMQIEDTFTIPRQMRERYPDSFLLRVVGESMNRVLPNGSYALVNPTSEAIDGKAYAVAVNGYDATIKRVRHLDNGIELSPDSTDPTIRPMVFDYADPEAETVTVIGEVVWYVVPFDFMG